MTAPSSMPHSSQSLSHSTHQSRYHLLSISLHWLMFLLIVAVYALIEGREFFPRGSETREAVKAWHFTLGLTVFVLIWLRIAARLFYAAPLIQPQAARWQLILAKAVHFALYALMILMPIGGWLILSAEGEKIPFWGMELPALTGPNEGLAETVEEIHETAGKVGYFLIGLHALAALFHHYYLKDNTLLRMLPFKQEK